MMFCGNWLLRSLESITVRLCGFRIGRGSTIDGIDGFGWFWVRKKKMPSLAQCVAYVFAAMYQRSCLEERIWICDTF